MGKNEMYLIYDGFENDVNDIFAPLINDLNFKIDYKSDYGVEMHNNVSKISILAENSMSIWMYNKKYSEGILLSQFLYNLDREKYNQFVSIANFIFNNRLLLEISNSRST